jgi:hypothetical protein
MAKVRKNEKKKKTKEKTNSLISLSTSQEKKNWSVEQIKADAASHSYFCPRCEILISFFFSEESS